MKAERDWRQEVRTSAVQFASTTHDRFRKSMEESLRLLPIDSSETRIFQLNSFIDVMVGVTVAVACEYAGSDHVLEEQLIKLARAKFGIIRQAEIAQKVKILPGAKPQEDYTQ